jgi:hypothetical protein
MINARTKPAMAAPITQGKTFTPWKYAFQVNTADPITIKKRKKNLFNVPFTVIESVRSPVRTDSNFFSLRVGLPDLKIDISELFNASKLIKSLNKPS